MDRAGFVFDMMIYSDRLQNGLCFGHVWSRILLKGLIMDGCVFGETTHSGVDVNNTHPSMINPDYNVILANLTLN